MLTFKNHITNTFNLAVPVIIGQLGLIMMGVVDSLMVGELGADYLAAAALANHIVILILIVGIRCFDGSYTINCHQHWCRKA